MNPLKISSLNKNYGAVQAVKNFNLELNHGEIFGLLGPNGAGKTTVISTIVTLEEPTSGQIEVFGYNLSENPQIAKMQIGLVPQEIINHGFFNVEEILQFYSGFFGMIHNQDRINFLLKKLSLWDHRHKKVRQLSGGMKRRLLVAKALVHSPKLLLLDEPTAGVDIELRENLWEFVRELKREGVTILLTTHYLEEAEELCDRVGIIHLGELKEIGDTRSLIQKITKRQVTFELYEKKFLQHPDLIFCEENKCGFQIPYGKKISDLFHELKLTLEDVRDLEIREGNLEDAFRSVLGSQK